MNVTKGQKHAGLFQWSASRRAQILKGTGIDVWKDANPQDQVNASIWELQNTQIPAAMKIALAPNAGAAAIAADKYYEVSGDNMVQQGIRGLVAQGYAAIGPAAPSTKPVLHDLPPDVKSLLSRLATRPAPPVKVSVTNSTSAKVAVSANAARG